MINKDIFNAMELTMNTMAIDGELLEKMGVSLNPRP